MNERHQGKLENVLYLAIFPLTFTIILLLVIFIIMGYPVGKTLLAWGNSVPVLEKLVPGPSIAEAATDSGKSESWKQKYQQKAASVKKKNEEIANLKEQLSSYQNNLEEMKQTNQQLERQVDTNLTKAFQEQTEKVASIYEKIPSSKAAAMLESMTLEDASLTLSMLDEEQQSRILSSMKDSKEAAQLTMIIKEMATLNETNEASLKAKIQEIAQIQNNPTQTLAETLSRMSAVEAAVMIKSMMGTNSQVAIELMKAIPTANRAQILSEIAKADSKLAVQITTSLN
ncbi:hypothetical protein J7E81_21785 [Bacillus sp. ISL-18]|uniref:MotE family protein n=1 Tax=Bacillus sp. ISL-18 TaxID=2819118 RepID=UPI001BEA54A0|nr:hypothetical protein [Bacillus sp. ISL-18]MBT2657836.1 hypothetical protein [Bacillus sp. ISL-18]